MVTLEQRRGFVAWADFSSYVVGRKQMSIITDGEASKIDTNVRAMKFDGMQ